MAKSEMKLGLVLLLFLSGCKSGQMVWQERLIIPRDYDMCCEEEWQCEQLIESYPIEKPNYTLCESQRFLVRIRGRIGSDSVKARRIDNGK